MSKEFLDKLVAGDIDSAINVIKESLNEGFLRTIEEKKMDIVKEAGFVKKDSDDDESDDGKDEGSDDDANGEDDKESKFSKDDKKKDKDD